MVGGLVRQGVSSILDINKERSFPSISRYGQAFLDRLPLILIINPSGADCDTRNIMRPLSKHIYCLPLVVALVLAGANYPLIPSDLTTPVQTRLAISGANCK